MIHLFYIVANGSFQKVAVHLSCSLIDAALVQLDAACGTHGCGLCHEQHKQQLEKIARAAHKPVLQGFEEKAQAKITHPVDKELSGMSCSLSQTWQK